MLAFLGRYADRQGLDLERNQVDPDTWIRDVGENDGCTVGTLEPVDNQRSWSMARKSRAVPSCRVAIRRDCSSSAKKHLTTRRSSWRSRSCRTGQPRAGSDGIAGTAPASPGACRKPSASWAVP